MNDRAPAAGRALGSRLLPVGLMVGEIMLVWVAALALCAVWDVARGNHEWAVLVLQCGTVWLDRRRRMFITDWKSRRDRARAARRAYDER